MRVWAGIAGARWGVASASCAGSVVKGPADRGGARAGAAPGVGDGGVTGNCRRSAPGRVRVRLFSAEFSVNRWVRRVEYVWVGARFDDKKGREAARGQQRAGAAHGGGPPSPRSPLPTLPLWSESSIASLQLYM